MIEETKKQNIIDYILVIDDSGYDLRNRVLKYIKDGYIPLGGASFDGDYYIQAMIKYG